MKIGIIADISFLTLTTHFCKIYFAVKFFITCKFKFKFNVKGI